MKIMTGMCRYRGGGGGQGVQTPFPLKKSQVAVGFRRNTDMDPPQEAIGPLGSNCFSREVIDGGQNRPL